MVVLFMLFQIEKSKIKLSTVYDEIFNDEKKKVREIYIRERIMEEYLFLKSVENDQEKVAKNQLSTNLVVEHFYENFCVDNPIKYEGIIMIDYPELFYKQKNIFWKYYLGHCFILVCNDFENIQMASNFMQILESFVKEEMLKTPEKIVPVLDTLLPSGQLMFMTVGFANNLMKK